MSAATWDRHRAELGDTLSHARREQIKKPCTICDKPTAAVSGVCPRHVLKHVTRETGV